MTKVVTAKTARDNFSQMLNLVDYGQTEVVVTRFDRPAVVWVDYEKFQKMNVNSQNGTKKQAKSGAEALLGLSKLGIKIPKGLDLSINYKKYLFDE